MAYGRFEVCCEIRHGGELSFEEVARVEEALRQSLDGLLSGCEPAWVDVRATGDEFSFSCSLKAADQEELGRVCLGLAALMDPDGAGRLVAVEAGFGPVRAWTFGAAGVGLAVMSGKSHI